jgi:3-hydroxyisobutyrate dehydrogenase
VHFLDGPVSGGKEGAEKGTMVMMLGGEAELVERLRPLLAVITRRIDHMGPVGAGQATKAVNQIMVAGINQAVTEALAFGEAQGLDVDKVIGLLGGGAAGNWFLDHRGPTMVRDTFAPGFKLALHHKDLKICQAMAADDEATLPCVEMTLLHYQRLIEAGHGDEDISALFRLKRSLFAK